MAQCLCTSEWHYCVTVTWHWLRRIDSHCVTHATNSFPPLNPFLRLLLPHLSTLTLSIHSLFLQIYLLCPSTGRYLHVFSQLNTGSKQYAPQLPWIWQQSGSMSQWKNSKAILIQELRWDIHLGYSPRTAVLEDWKGTSSTYILLHLGLVNKVKPWRHCKCKTCKQHHVP